MTEVLLEIVAASGSARRRLGLGGKNRGPELEVTENQLEPLLSRHIANMSSFQNTVGCSTSSIP